MSRRARLRLAPRAGPALLLAAPAPAQQPKASAPAAAPGVPAPAPPAAIPGAEVADRASLDFLVRCWIAEPDLALVLRSQIALDIHRALREAGIEIPYPQRDLHPPLGRSGGGEGRWRARPRRGSCLPCIPGRARIRGSAARAARRRRGGIA